jgi:hypothetical protein
MSVLIHIPNFHNEYKFVLVAAIGGAPLLALFMERLWFWHRARVGRPAVASLVLLVGATGLYGLSWQLFPPEIQGTPPQTRVLDLKFHGPHQTVENENGLGEAMMAIREKTQPGTPVLIGATDFHITPFTRRPVYIPYKLDSNLLGLAMVTEYLLSDVKGFDHALVEARSRRLERFVAPTSPDDRSTAFSEIADEIGNAVAVIVDETAQPDLSNWLTENGASKLYSSASYSAWQFK